MPKPKIAGSQWGAPGSCTLAGPPERMSGAAGSELTDAIGRDIVAHDSREGIAAPRTRGAMSWTYCSQNQGPEPDVPRDRSPP